MSLVSHLDVLVFGVLLNVVHATRSTLGEGDGLGRLGLRGRLGLWNRVGNGAKSHGKRNDGVGNLHVGDEHGWSRL